MKIINIVDKEDRLIASISGNDIILHNDYSIIETEDEDELTFYNGNGEMVTDIEPA